jgi:hypothetical protein
MNQPLKCLPLKLEFVGCCSPRPHYVGANNRILSREQVLFLCNNEKWGIAKIDQPVGQIVNKETGEVIPPSEILKVVNGQSHIVYAKYENGCRTGVGVVSDILGNYQIVLEIPGGHIYDDVSFFKRIEKILS